MRIAIIMARSGSERFPKKNYHPFVDGMNLVEIAKDKCLKSGQFDKIVITSDDTYFKQYCNDDVTEFHHRSEELTSSSATTDQVMDCLFEEYNCTSMMVVNSPSPLQTVQDIIKCAETLTQSDCVLAVNTIRQHCDFNDRPLNYNPLGPLEPQQMLKPIRRHVHSCMGWNREAYVASRKAGFKGLFPGKLELVEVSPQAGMLIKYEEDFELYKKIAKVL